MQKKASNLDGQGLLYFSSKYKFNPHLPFKLIYKLENEDQEQVKFSLDYTLPKVYLKDYENNADSDYKSLSNIFSENKLETIIGCLTILTVSLIFIFFTQTLSKKRILFSYVRVIFSFYRVTHLL